MERRRDDWDHSVVLASEKVVVQAGNRLTVPLQFLPRHPTKAADANENGTHANAPAPPA
jgi:hypothetical protein